DTAAATAGLKAGETIVSVNGKPAADRVELAAAIAQLKPGTTVQLGVKRGESTENVALTIPEPDLAIYVAGEPRLYGWVYSYASDVFWILTVTYCMEWILRWLYFHDWRGALRPTLTGVIAAFWGLAFVSIIGFSLNPLVYYYLRAPDPEVVMAREKGWYKAFINRVTDWNLSSVGKVTTLVFWLSLFAVGLFLMRGLIVGDPTSASPLVWEDSPYNVSHAHIQDKFGGVEPLIVVAEGKDRDAMKDPKVLRTMENFQRYLERDRDVGY